MDAQPSYSWRNKQATVLKGRVSGENFLPLPGGYQPSSNSRPRGGQVPRVTDVAVSGGVIDITQRSGGSFADAAPTAEAFFPTTKGESSLRRANRDRVGAEMAGRRFGVGF